MDVSISPPPQYKVLLSCLTINHGFSSITVHKKAHHLEVPSSCLIVRSWGSFSSPQDQQAIFDVQSRVNDLQQRSLEQFTCQASFYPTFASHFDLMQIEL